MSWVLGVDGGNTKTIALVARDDGAIVGQGRSECSDIYGAPSPEVAVSNLEGAAALALKAAGLERWDLSASAFSVAGCDWPEDSEFLEHELRARGFASRCTVVNDAMGALWSGSADGVGVAVVCGTGAATGARGPDGRTWHSGWWQEPQGSRQLAQKTLRAVYRAHLRVDQPTSLTDRTLLIVQRNDVEDVLHAFTARQHRLSCDVGSLTRALLEEAAGGDHVARRIVHDHGTSLGDYALAAARKVGIDRSRFPLVLTGGVLRHPSTVLSDAIVTRVLSVSGACYPVKPCIEPAAGAILLALDSLHVAPHEVVAMVESTHPPASLFDTASV